MATPMMTAPRYSRPTTVATAGTDRLTQRTTTAHSGSKTKRRASPPPPVDILDTKTGKRYTRGRFLGKGGFARCFEMIDKETNEIFAGKVVPKRKLVKQHAKDKLASEVKIHKALDHSRVVKFYSFFEDEAFVYILLELCSNKSLMEMHKKRHALSEPEVRFFLKQIVEATEYMHANKVIHRDLKLGNLFLNDDMCIKVGDFGLATRVRYDGERKKTMCGTPNYIAPEILRGKEGHSYEVDVWSIGCILYTLLCGRPPFETQNLKTTYTKIQNNDYRIPSHLAISEEAKDLIRRTLSGNPSERPTVAQIAEHPFLTKYFVPATLSSEALELAPTFESEHLVGPATTSTIGKAAARELREPLRALNQKSSSTTPVAIKMEKRTAVVSSPAPAYPHSAKEQVPPARSVVSSSLRREAELADAARGPSAPRSDRKDSLHSIYRRIRAVLQSQQGATSMSPPVPVDAATADNGQWIVKWCDYSNKYGLGYQLADGSCGVLFNDMTKMVLAADEYHVESIERDSSGNRVTLLTLSDYPEELTKKVTLLKYFRSYMSEHLLNSAEAAKASPASPPPRSATGLAHVRKWLRTRHGIVFRLSNGVIQLNFFDHSKLILAPPRSGSLTYINKQRETTHYMLDDIASSGAVPKDLLSRLSYTADVVDLIIKNSGTASGKQV